MAELEDIADNLRISYGERRSMIHPSAPTLATFELISSPSSGLLNLRARNMTLEVDFEFEARAASKL